MELLLVRHGLPVRRELVDGAADPELSAAGHAQASTWPRTCRREHLDAIYASPLRRAYQTAEPLAARHAPRRAGVRRRRRVGPDSNEYVPIEELKAANDPR